MPQLIHVMTDTIEATEAYTFDVLHDIAQVLAARSGERETLHEILQILST